MTFAALHYRYLSYGGPQALNQPRGGRSPQLGLLATDARDTARGATPDFYYSNYDAKVARGAAPCSSPCTAHAQGLRGPRAEAAHDSPVTNPPFLTGPSCAASTKRSGNVCLACTSATSAAVARAGRARRARQVT